MLRFLFIYLFICCGGGGGGEGLHFFISFIYDFHVDAERMIVNVKISASMV